jgi:hypothetical protein
MAAPVPWVLAVTSARRPFNAPVLVVSINPLPT